MTAKITREPKNRLSSLGMSAVMATLGAWGRDEEYKEIYTLKLNYPLDIAQIKIKFIPKYSALQQITLTVSCAPSLEKCYIFELVTQSRLTNFQKYDVIGTEAIKRWYNIGWNENFSRIPESISIKINELIKDHLKAIEARLNKEK